MTDVRDDLLTAMEFWRKRALEAELQRDHLDGLHTEACARQWQLAADALKAEDALVETEASLRAAEEAKAWRGEHVEALEKNWDRLVDIARTERDAALASLRAAEERAAALEKAVADIQCEECGWYIHEVTAADCPDCGSLRRLLAASASASSDTKAPEAKKGQAQ